MDNLWSRFDSITTADEVASAVTDFSPMDAGIYDSATLEEIVATENKDGLPTMKAKFRVDGRAVVYFLQLQNLNYPSVTATNCALANNMVNKILGVDDAFVSLSKLAHDIEVAQETQVGLNYKIDISYNMKRDPERKWAIVKVLDFATVDVADDGNDEDIPF